MAINQARTERIAAVYGVSDARVAVLPNLVLAAGGRGRPAAIEFARLQVLGLRLDRTAAISDLAREAEHGLVDPEDGIRRLEEIAAMQHRFGLIGVIAGHMVLTMGLALILQPTPEALGLSAVFGALVGALKAYVRNMHTVGVLLPGSPLTTAALELSAGDVISGASQLVGRDDAARAAELRDRRRRPDRRRPARRRDQQRSPEHDGRVGAVAREWPSSAPARSCTSPGRAGRSTGCSSSASPPGSGSSSARS